MRALGLQMVIAMLLSFAGGAAHTRETGGAWENCARPIAAAERAHAIPAQLLQAISLAESGRWHKARRAKFAWPWTVTAEGRGRHLPNKEAAISHVKTLRARGITNIDVGCMQINLHHHPKAFADLDRAFDPAPNADYAARFLHRLRQASRSWSLAIGPTEAFGKRYRTKIYGLWRDERQRAYRIARLARIKAFRERRARQRAARKVSLRLAQRGHSRPGMAARRPGR